MWKVRNIKVKPVSILISVIFYSNSFTALASKINLSNSSESCILGTVMSLQNFYSNNSCLYTWLKLIELK